MGNRMKASYNLRPGKTIAGAVDAVILCLRGDDMEIQTFFQDNMHIIQARASNAKLKFLIGRDKAIEVRLMPAGNDAVIAEVGGARWLDKVIWLYCPLRAISAWSGLREQRQIINRVEKVINAYFNS